MAIIHRCLAILYCLVFFCFFCIGICYAESSLMAGQVMRDYQFLDSPNERFRLLFFSPDFTSNRYLGIQFTYFLELKLVWVANRENPLTDTSGVVNITQDGNMIISDGKGTSISLNSQQPVINGSSNTSLSLLDSGNLVLRSRNQTVWQSFDYPSDTWLPGMKLGLFGLKTGKPQSRFLTSWISPNAPAAGPYTLGIDPNNTNQLVVWRRGVLYWRSGMWNGKNFSYFPNIETDEDSFNLSYFSNENDSYYTFSPFEDNNRFAGIGINSSGSFDQYEEFNQSGSESQSIPNCDNKNGESSQGCEMAKPSNCKGGDEFPLVRSGAMSEWDYTYNFTLSLSDCKEICKKRCSCTAYSSANSDGTGCQFSQGQKLDFPDTWFSESFYIRNRTIVDKVQPTGAAGSTNKEEAAVVDQPTVLLDQPTKRRRLWLIIGGPVVSLAVVSLLSLLCYLGRRNCYFGGIQITHTHMSVCVKMKDKKRRSSQGDTELIMNELGASMTAIDKLSGAHNIDFSGKKDHQLNLFNFSSIQVATDHFSDANKLGQGGFGPVYKGKLVDGQEIAVKRLSRTSGQGLEEFKNEVILISKLQHRNLVTLLGCCIQGEERILIYEYLPNKSLDYFLFDATKRALLDWKKRSSIITGIAQGLLYLHKYSKLRIIHRDLKTSNILLDTNMNPKISDFGTARIFGEDESRANTNRIVGTYGYMSPEYAMDGLFSVKSDVFSFGVMMLEIVSGKKNTGFYQSDRYLNLLGYAWDLWKEGRCLELMQQELLDDSCSTDDVMRCVQVGLLCVQENAASRPTMSDVMSMLSHELVNLPAPKQPAFLTISSVNDNAVLLENPRPCTINDVTTSEIQAR